MEKFSHSWQYLADFFLQWEVFQIKVVEKVKTHILCSVTFFRKLWRLWDKAENVEGTRGFKNDVTIGADALHVGKARLHARKHARTPKRPGNHIHARAQARTHTHIHICNAYWFSTAIMICERAAMLRYTRWFKYDRDYLCVNKSQFVPVIFEPPCNYITSLVYLWQESFLVAIQLEA